jgi:prolyl oligopeptidase
LFNKQNCFDDFICAAEHLIAEGVTTSEQLCIQGGSNGGLLVLACALQRPRLYRAVISQVPVADMLRFHRFTIGHAWCTEYGNAEESKADFDNVMKYSPLHNVKEVKSEVSWLSRCVCVAEPSFPLPQSHTILLEMLFFRRTCCQLS